MTARKPKTRLQTALRELQTVIYGRVSGQGQDLILRRVEGVLKDLVEAEVAAKKVLVIRYRQGMDWQTVGKVKSKEAVARRMARFIRLDLGMKPEDVDLPADITDAEFVRRYFDDGDGSEGYEVEEV